MLARGFATAATALGDAAVGSMVRLRALGLATAARALALALVGSVERYGITLPPKLRGSPAKSRCF